MRLCLYCHLPLDDRKRTRHPECKTLYMREYKAAIYQGLHPPIIRIDTVVQPPRIRLTPSEIEITRCATRGILFAYEQAIKRGDQIAVQSIKDLNPDLFP